MKAIKIILLSACLLLSSVIFSQSEINNNDKATIYIIRTSAKGRAINFKYFADNKYVGKCKYGQYLKIELEPGEHLIWAKSENVSFLEAYLRAGKVYIINAVPKMGGIYARVRLTAIPNQDIELSEAQEYISEMELLEFDDETLNIEQQELWELIAKSLTKYELDWKDKKEMDFLSVPVDLEVSESPIVVEKPEEPHETISSSVPLMDYPFGPVTLIFNPLGFAQFGPVIEADIMLADRLSIVPHLRFAGLGATMHAISGYDELSYGSMAFGVGVRGFLGKFNRPGKTYIGGIFELGWGKGKDNPETYSEKRYEFATFSIIPHAGYRWRFSSGFIMNLGGSLAIAYTYKDQKVYPTFYEYYGELNVIPMAEFSLGWEIR